MDSLIDKGIREETRVARQDSVEFRTFYRTFVENVIFRQNVGRNKTANLPHDVEGLPPAGQLFQKNTHFSENRSKLDVFIKNRSRIDRIRRNSSKIVGKS